MKRLTYFVLTAWLVSLIYINLASPLANKSHRRLIGDDVKYEIFPYIVTIEMKSSTDPDSIPVKCSGSLISKHWVLTAAHCLFYDLYQIRYGNKPVEQNNSKAFTSEILKQIRHHYKTAFPYIQVPRESRYLNSKYVRVQNDIGLYNNPGLLQVKTVYIEEYGTLSAVEHSSLIGYEIQVFGFGETHPNRPISRVSLKTAHGMVIQCRNPQILMGNFICLSYRCDKRQSLLSGDSGGPLIHAGKIVGVNIGVDTGRGLGYSTPVAPYISWIYETIKRYDGE